MGFDRLVPSAVHEGAKDIWIDGESRKDYYFRCRNSETRMSVIEFDTTLSTLISEDPSFSESTFLCLAVCIRRFFWATSVARDCQSKNKTASETATTIATKRLNKTLFRTY